MISELIFLHASKEIQEFIKQKNINYQKVIEESLLAYKTLENWHKTRDSSHIRVGSSKSLGGRSRLNIHVVYTCLLVCQDLNLNPHSFVVMLKKEPTFAKVLYWLTPLACDKSSELNNLNLINIFPKRISLSYYRDQILGSDLIKNLSCKTVEDIQYLLLVLYPEIDFGDLLEF